MGGSFRVERVAGLILHELSRLLREEVRDPRLANTVLTLHEVRLSRDFSRADVYVSALAKDREQEILAALKKAKGFLRTQLAASLDLRRVPELLFHFDSSIEEGFRLERLIEEANRTQ
jgi:ribosome-binding factor A